MSTTNPPAHMAGDDQGDRGREPPREDDARYFVVRELKLCTGCNQRHVGPWPCKKRSHSKVSAVRLPQSPPKTIKKTPTVFSPRDQSNMNIDLLMGGFHQLRKDVMNLESRVDAAFGNEVSQESQSTRATIDSSSIDVEQVRQLISDASMLIYFADRAIFPRPAADDNTNNNVQDQIIGSPQLRSPSLKTLSMQSQDGRLLSHSSRLRRSSRVPYPESDSSGSRDYTGLFGGPSKSIPPEASAGNVPDSRVRNVPPMVISRGYDHGDTDTDNSEDHEDYEDYEPVGVVAELDKEDEADAKRLRTSKKSS